MSARLRGRSKAADRRNSSAPMPVSMPNWTTLNAILPFLSQRRPENKRDP